MIKKSQHCQRSRSNEHGRWPNQLAC